MNLNKLFSIFANKNINKADILNIVGKVKNTDLSDEDNIRSVIREVSHIANKTLPIDKEDELVRKIKNEGIPKDIFSLFN